MILLNLKNSAFKKLDLKLVKNSPSSESSKLSLTRCQTIIPKLLQIFLCLTGLLEINNNKRLKKTPIVLFGLLLLFTSVDNLVILLEETKQHKTIRYFFAYIFTFPLMGLLWFIMYLRRKKVSDLLYKFRKLSVPLHHTMVNFLTAILFCLPFLFAAVILIFTIKTEPTFYTYGYAMKEKWLQNVITYVKNCIYTFIFPIFPNMVALFYCIMCLQSSCFIKLLSDEIILCSPHSFTPSKRIKIIRLKSKMDDILGSIQDNFSLPSFIIISVNLLACFSILGLYLDTTTVQFHGVVIFVEWALYANSSIAGLVFILWMAGSVPIEDSRFKEEFHKKLKMRMLLYDSSEEIELEKWVITRPEFVFTGWNILSYRRSSVFALVGSLITYTVLVAH